MNQPETINICFEIFCAGIAFANLFKILKDKSVSGMFWQSWIIFTAWRFWDAFYVYPALNMSIAAKIALACAFAQGAWVLLAIFFVSKKKYKF